MGLTTQGACCSGAYKFLGILFHMVGNFTEICPNFIIVSFSILYIPKGALGKPQEAGTVQALSGHILQPTVATETGGTRTRAFPGGFQMDSILPTDVCLTGASGRKAGRGC